MPTTAGIPEERFRERLTKTESCWLWTGVINVDGYAMFWNGKRTIGAHRWSYEHFVGPIPKGLELDHLCRVRHCVNPSHLEPVTHQENVRRAGPPWNAGATHCKNGHELTTENTRMRGSCRICRACAAECQRRYRARQAARAEAKR